MSFTPYEVMEREIKEEEYNLEHEKIEKTKSFNTDKLEEKSKVWFSDEDMEKISEISKVMNELNNGGSTEYYKFKIPKDEEDVPVKFIDAQDIIEWREMNYAQGNILKVAWTFNIGRHDGTDYERELNKIIYFAKRELNRLKQNEQQK